MTATVVLDASAAVHLVMGTDYAADFARRLEEAVTVAAPDLFFSEVGNSLWKYVRSGELPLEKALPRLDEAMALVDSVVPGSELAYEALVAAAKNQHSVYDMMYAVLARRYGASVFTMDRGFAGLLRKMDVTVYYPPRSEES